MLQQLCSDMADDKSFQGEGLTHQSQVAVAVSVVALSVSLAVCNISKLTFSRLQLRQHVVRLYRKLNWKIPAGLPIHKLCIIQKLTASSS
jgi:hypothetical protein